LLVTGGLDVTDDDNPAHLMVWNVGSGKVLKRTRLPHAVTSVAFSPDGRWIAAANRQKHVLLWRVPDLMDQ
jgi:WD40 repeat protein